MRSNLLPPFLIWGLLAGSSHLHGGDYDKALSVFSRAIPHVKIVAVFYDANSTLLSQLEFETSAYQEFGINIKLVPLESKDRISIESLRTLCIRNRVQGILLLDGDPIVTPKSPIGKAVAAQARRIPVAAINGEWLSEGVWFVIGPTTKGLQIGPKIPDAKAKAALESLIAEFK